MARLTNFVSADLVSGGLGAVINAGGRDAGAFHCNGDAGCVGKLFGSRDRDARVYDNQRDDRTTEHRLRPRPQTCLRLSAADKLVIENRALVPLGIESFVMGNDEPPVPRLMTNVTTHNVHM